MNFAEIRTLVDAGLEAEPRIAGSRRELQGEDCVWTLNEEAVTISASGSTGILVEYVSHRRTTYRKIFAASPISIDRIITTAVEHLTAYVRT